MSDPTIEITIDDITPEMVREWIDTHLLRFSMSRSLITKWEDLTTAHVAGDRLTIFVRDVTGKMKIIDCHIYGVYREGDAEYDEDVERWSILEKVKGVSDDQVR